MCGCQGGWVGSTDRTEEFRNINFTRDMTERSYSNPTIRNLHFISLISALFSLSLQSLFRFLSQLLTWRICASPACRIWTLAHVPHNVWSPCVCTQIEANWLQIKSKEQKLSSCILMYEGHGTGNRTRRRRPACSQVIVRYLTHLQQENNRYSICTRQISKAVQFIKANYWYKMLEVISTRHILHSFRHRPSALLLWIRVLPARLHNGLTVQRETGWSDYLTLPSATKDPDCNCKSSNVAQGHWL